MENKAKRSTSSGHDLRPTRQVDYRERRVAESYSVNRNEEQDTRTSESPNSESISVGVVLRVDLVILKHNYLRLYRSICHNETYIPYLFLSFALNLHIYVSFRLICKLINFIFLLKWMFHITNTIHIPFNHR